MSEKIWVLLVSECVEKGLKRIGWNNCYEIKSSGIIFIFEGSDTGILFYIKDLYCPHDLSLAAVQTGSLF